MPLSDHLLLRKFRDEQAVGVGFRAAVLDQAHVISANNPIRGLDTLAYPMNLFDAKRHICPGDVLNGFDRADPKLGDDPIFLDLADVYLVKTRSVSSNTNAIRRYADQNYCALLRLRRQCRSLTK